MGSDYNSLALAPNFNPHRKNVAAAEVADVTNQKAGVASLGFDQVIMDLKLESGSLTSVTLEVLYWSEASGKYVAPTVAEEATFTAPSQATFNPVGRHFFVRVKDLVGAAPKVSVFLAGVASESGQ